MVKVAEALILSSERSCIELKNILLRYSANMLSLSTLLLSLLYRIGYFDIFTTKWKLGLTINLADNVFATLPKIV